MNLLVRFWSYNKRRAVVGMALLLLPVRAFTNPFQAPYDDRYRLPQWQCPQLHSARGIIVRYFRLGVPHAQVPNQG